MEEIHRGAEAVIYKEGDKIIKKRIPKSYRLKEIDEKLRGQRTRREAKVIRKLAEAEIPGPGLISTDDEETIHMEFLEGQMLADFLNERNVRDVMYRVGQIVADLHDNEMIHGDLTTSNMMFSNGIYLIDFGLSFFSAKEEDKAVDIHLLKEALEAKHHECWKEGFEAFKQGYKNSNDYKAVMKRLEEVESRGRYKGK